MLGGLLLLGAAVFIGLDRFSQTARQRRAARAGAALAREQAAAESLRAAEQAAQDRLARALARLQPPPVLAGGLLAALARTTPAAIVLREVTCAGDNFVIRGHVHDGAAGPDNPLARFRRDLGPPDAPWRISDSASGSADFTWSGSFLRPAAAPVTTAALEAQLTTARAALLPAGDFDAWLRDWSRPWKILAHSAEPSPDLEVRHYALAYGEARLRAWSGFVHALQAAAAEPGVTVDSLVLTAAPDGADAFTQARITLTARLRP
jgi:hypothetical protein